MKQLQNKAKALVNASSSSEDYLQHMQTPMRPSTAKSTQRPRLQLDIQSSEVRQTSTNPPQSNKGILKSFTETKKPAQKKVTVATSTRDNIKAMKKQLSEENSKVQVLQEEMDRVNMNRNDLQTLNLEYEQVQSLQAQADRIDKLQAQMDAIKDRENILIDQLNEQTSLAKEALIQAQETRICMEENQISFVENMRKEQQEKQVMRTQFELQFSRLLEEKLMIRSKELELDLQKRYENKIHLIERENDELRMENITLQRKLVSIEGKKVSDYETRRMTFDDTDVFSKLRQLQVRTPLAKQELLENEIRGLQRRLESMGDNMRRSKLS